MTAALSAPDTANARAHPTCRITNITQGWRRGSFVTNGCAPFVLTAERGFTTDVEQGVPYEDNAGIGRWAGHACLSTVGAAPVDRTGPA